MDLTKLKAGKEKVSAQTSVDELQVPVILDKELKVDCSNDLSVSIEAEIPEELYKGMKEFIYSNPQWDQYNLMSSALANFLFQNGSEDRAVTEKYLNDLFTLTDS